MPQPSVYSRANVVHDANFDCPPPRSSSSKDGLPGCSLWTGRSGPSSRPLAATTAMRRRTRPSPRRRGGHFPTAGGVYSSPTVANGVVYVRSDDGNVYAFSLPRRQSRLSGRSSRSFTSITPSASGPPASLTRQGCSANSGTACGGGRDMLFHVRRRMARLASTAETRRVSLAPARSIISLVCSSLQLDG
jgi:hypothetical protein